MILDKVSALDFYGPLIPHYERIGAFLKESGYAGFEPGRYDIEGTGSYLLIQHYHRSNEDEKKWESHRRHLDIQIVLSGQEYIAYAEIGGLEVLEPYNDEKDVIFYRNPEQAASIWIGTGSFCVFYPRDGHKPGFHRSQPEAVVKAVVKVRL
jgi:YhcH/YjgK/YiaL family protein